MEFKRFRAQGLGFRVGALKGLYRDYIGVI